MVPALVVALLLGAWRSAPGEVPRGQWPVQPASIVRSFSPPAVDWAAGHRGIDLAVSTGQEVHSMRAGVVTFAGTVAGVPVVSVAYPGSERLRSTYEPVVASVAIGQEVPLGGLLGTVAPGGGHCGGERGCLHVGLRTDTRYLDPRVLVSRLPAVLKPQARSRGRTGAFG